MCKDLLRQSIVFSRHGLQQIVKAELSEVERVNKQFIVAFIVGTLTDATLQYHSVHHCITVRCTRTIECFHKS